MRNDLINSPLFLESFPSARCHSCLVVGHAPVAMASKGKTSPSKASTESKFSVTVKQ